MPNRTYAPQDLADAAANSSSITGVLRHLGLPISGGRRTSVRQHLDALGIDTSHFRRPVWTKYSSAQLTAAVAASSSVYEVLDHLGIPRRGGAHAHISRRIKAAGIDTSHFPPALGPSADPCEHIDPAALTAAAKSARSMSEVLRRLQIPKSQSNLGHVRRHLRDLGIAPPAGYWRMDFDEPTIVQTAASSHSVAEMLRRLGLPVNPSNHRRIVRLLDRYGAETSHFRRSPTRIAKPRARSDPRAVLVQRHFPANRVPGTKLRQALLLCGVRAQCAICGLGERWQGNPLRLEVDHVNGDSSDNRRENLRFLCPNCHSQTPTFAGRNRGQRPLRARP